MADYEKLWVVSIPLRTPFRGITNREALVIKGERFAEWSPFTEYGDQEASTWLKAAISFSQEPLPILRRNYIPTNATLPAVRPDEVADTLAPFENFKTVKIKVAQSGQSIKDDLGRINKTHELYPHAKLRLDANGGYSLDQAKALVDQLAGFPIEYLEQPVKSIEELAKLRTWLSGSYLVAADESIRKTLDPKIVVEAGAADILMLKAQPLGGISEALRVLDFGLDVVVSSALETSLGIAQGAYLAAAIPELRYDCGLGTINLLAGDIVTNSLRPENSALEVRMPEVSVERLEKYRASPEREAWWIARFERCLELL